MPPLPGEQGPRAPLPIPDERPAILSLPVPVVVVPPPAWTVRRVHFEHGIQHAQGIHDDGIVRLPDAVPNKLEEPPVDDLLRGKPPAGTRGPVVQDKETDIGVLGRERVVHVHRKNADVMPRYPGGERPLGSHHPCFDVAFEEVGVLFEECGSRRVSPFAGEGGRADERRDVGGDGGRGVAAGLLPPLLLGRRSMEKEVADRPHHHTVGVEVPETPPCAAGATPGGWGTRPRRAGSRASTVRRRSRNSGEIRRPRPD